MARDVRQWLEGLGLGNYAQAFEENAIGLHLLSGLTNEDLREIGVAKLGHRKELLAAIAALSAVATDASPAAIPALEPATPARPEAERRQLTVMFCDLADSTALSSRMDPEEFREIILRYHDACAQVIGTYDGYVARYLGDGALVYFGYPQAHEDDAERAVHAGVGIVDAIEILNGEIGQASAIELAVRIGIATGPVVVGDIVGTGASQESMVLGETPNLAARLQALAEKNAVVISDATQRLVEGVFVCDAQEPQNLKGLPHPVTVYRVREATGAPGRFEAATTQHLTPLVGRESEVGLLLDRWESAKQGDGQVVVLSADAGIGKSRILRAFRDRLKDEPHSRILYYGSAHHQNSALFPVADQLGRVLRLRKEDDPQHKLDALETVLASLEIPVTAHAPIIASLLSLATNGRYPPLELPPEEMKKRIFGTMATMVEAMAARTPVLIMVEDLHWIDPSTLEFLDLLVERLRDSRALLVGATRPVLAKLWADHSHVTILTLNRLSRRESAALISKVAQGKSLPNDVLDEIIAKTDGIPLFVEEFTKTVLESGLLQNGRDGYELSGPLPTLAIPASLQDSLMARLDRLGSVKELAQLAATLGRSFRRDVLAAISPLAEAALDDALSRLVTAGLLYRRGSTVGATYEFKHALVQNAAYGSLLKSVLRQHHRRIGETLHNQFPEIAETQPELLAHHFSQAGHLELAIAYWERAGERAVGQSANLEAISHLTTGLDLIKKLPDERARIERELTLLLILGPALMANKGWSAPEVESTYTRARELSRQAGLAPQQFIATWGIWFLNQSRANHRMGREVAGELLDLSKDRGDSSHLLQAYHASWTTQLYTGELDQAWQNVRLGLSIYDPREHGRHALTYGGHDPGVCGNAQSALLLWLKGYPDQSLRNSERAVASAEELGHLPSLAHALYFAARLRTMRREPTATLAFVDAFAETAEKLGLAQYLRSRDLFRGWALIELGKQSQSLVEITNGLAVLRDIHKASSGPHNISLVAQSLSKLEQTPEALQIVGEALEISERTGERYWEAELYRQKGALLPQESASGASEAEAYLQKAIDISRSQDAKSLELRATMGMCQLLQQQNRKAEARAMLTPIYYWFSEGFDTADLKDAKALLDDLSES